MPSGGAFRSRVKQLSPPEQAQPAVQAYGDLPGGGSSGRAKQRFPQSASQTPPASFPPRSSQPLNLSGPDTSLWLTWPCRPFLGVKGKGFGAAPPT